MGEFDAEVNDSIGKLADAMLKAAEQSEAGGLTAEKRDFINRLMQSVHNSPAAGESVFHLANSGESRLNSYASSVVNGIFDAAANGKFDISTCSSARFANALFNASSLGAMNATGRGEFAAKGSIEKRKIPVDSDDKLRYTLVSANIRFVNKTELLYRNAKNIKPLEGYEDITCHADPDSFYIDMVGNQDEKDFFTITPEEYADIIRNSASYKGGDIRIISCQSGAKEDGAAYRLAKALGVNVYAPTETVNVDENGEMFICDNEVLSYIWYSLNSEERKGIKETGTWKVFEGRK